MSDCSESDFDHHSDDFVADPYSQYRTLRSKCPVSFSSHHGGFWLLTKYADVRRTLLAWETYSSGYPGRVAIPNTPREQSKPLIPIEVDPPLHGDYRAKVAPYFSKTSVAMLETTATELAHSIIDTFINDDNCELVKDFSEPFFSKLLAFFLKLPIEDSKHWIRWANAIFARRLTHPDEAEQARNALTKYVEHLFEERRISRTDDLFSALLDTRVNGKRLTNDELLGYGMEILLAGREATIDGISNAMAYLSQNKEAQKSILEEKVDIETAIEEFLRWDSPIQLLGRVANRNVKLDGKDIAKGDSVAVSYASANRDEQKFLEPDQCILDRAPNPHLAFGIGSHTCIGLHLARLGLKVAITSLIQRLTPFYEDPILNAIRKPNGDARGFLLLPIRF